MSVTLVDLLEAELAIRRSRFDEARSLLEKVVRGVEIDTGLRGRAQWLIGETHYLQHHFANAIDAYRSVEGVDPTGPWVAASMIQAGKAFEQLGRTREAAVCYGNLLGRFADSPHADSARRRMAAINPSQQPASSQSIRR
jgi:TolA-binding protein